MPAVLKSRWPNKFPLNKGLESKNMNGRKPRISMSKDKMINHIAKNFIH